MDRMHGFILSARVNSYVSGGSTWSLDKDNNEGKEEKRILLLTFSTTNFRFLGRALETN